jgi:hypothetical protein
MKRKGGEMVLHQTGKLCTAKETVTRFNRHHIEKEKNFAT